MIFMLRKTNFLFSLIGILFLVTTQPKADKICNFKLKNCPEDFNGKVVYVPENVSSISPDFKVCIPVTVIENGTSTPPSIVFIIDHSNSMMGSTGYDRDGSRFLVTSALLDTLYNKFPDAEVGLVVFYDKLYFNSDDDSMFKKLPDGFAAPQELTNQAYVPLMKLNVKQKNGQTGIEYLKYILQTKKIVSSVRRTDTTWSTDMVYQPTGYERAGGTHINVAFDAAKEAMKTAAYAKENQYVIFISDGEANETTAPTPTTEYEQGVGVPTTFTVFFTGSGNGVAPASLQTMTDNIKANGYSTSNPASQLWTIQTNFETLMKLVMQNIFNPLIFSLKQKPMSLTINNKSYTSISDSSTFDIGNGLTLNDSLTHFDIAVKYSVKSDSLNVQKDTTVKVAFDVIRSDERAVSEGIALTCHDTIYYTISVQATDADAKEKDANPGTITVSRNYTVGPLTVYFSREGTATHKDDYTISAVDSVVFKDGEKSVTITITPVNDNIDEETENVTVTLLDKFSNKEIRYYINNSQNKATINIEDSYVPAPDTLTIHITPNPFTPSDKAEFSSKIKSMFNNVIKNNSTGMLVAVHSTELLEKVPGTADQYGTGYIYDAVGNLVKIVEIKKANTNKSDTTNYGFLWDCTNTNQRAVGLGTYLIKIHFKEINGQERVFTRKMGVKE
jgi:hypothetical protein